MGLQRAEPFLWVSAMPVGVRAGVQEGKRRRAVPVGIMTDSAVAEADLMTLPPVRELRFSAVESPESCWCRARRSTKSLVALGADGSSSFGGCSSPAFDLLPIVEGRERDDDSSPTSQDHVPGTPHLHTRDTGQSHHYCHRNCPPSPPWRT